MFLDVEPHLRRNLDRSSIGCTGTTVPRGSFSTHVIGADQGTYSLQRAEGIILAVRLAVAGIPDQVVVLLVGQYVRRGPL